MNFEGRKKILGAGSALVDILIFEPDDFLLQCGAVKGGMLLVENEKIYRVLELSSSDPVIVAGGSACNTAVGVSRLGGRAGFFGKCADDEYGRIFKKSIEEALVTPHLITGGPGTGKVVSIVTPDAQRSMLTFLGSAAEISCDDIRPDLFDDVAVCHVEGYWFFNPDLIFSTFETAKKQKAIISLDLASFNLVKESRELIKDAVEKYVDILIANEEEAVAYTGSSDPYEAVHLLKQDVSLAALKLGIRGSLVLYADHLYEIEAVSSNDIVDTTGAGDLWAAGFLYGLVEGYGIKDCGRLASLCGCEVSKRLGAHIPDDGWYYIKEMWGKNG